MIEIAELSRDDAGAVEALAALHGRCLRGSALTRLGPAALRRFYRFVAGSAEDVALLARDGATVVGGLVVSFDPAGLPRRLVLSGALLPHLPRLALMALMARGTEGAGASPPGDVPEVTHVFVAENARGQGVARALMVEAEAVCASRGAARYWVKTAAAGDNAALSFYRGGGYTEIGETVEQGRRFIAFVKDIAQPAEHGG